nr:phenoloxidase-activating factor 2 [Drosophila simulans]
MCASASLQDRRRSRTPRHSVPGSKHGLLGMSSCNNLLSQIESGNRCNIHKGKLVLINNRTHLKVPNIDPSRPLQCGHVNSLELSSTMKRHQYTAREAEVPWMVALLDARNLEYWAGGSLIAPDVVLTAAFVTEKLNEYQLIVRAGEWDLLTKQEQGQHKDVSIRKIVRHYGFNRTNGANNVALLFLKKPLELTHHINLICLPPPNRNFIYNRCIVSGWGKKNFEDMAYMNVQKKIDVPLVDRSRCQRQLQGIFGKNFYLDRSLMCAGGEIGKDACKGDGGSPLACPLQSDPNRYEQVGIVNYGLGCGTTIPAVYTDVSKMRTWIDYQIRENSNAYQPQNADDGGKLRKEYFRNL